MHVETALRGLLISERWPKSGVDIVITVLEGEDDGPSGLIGSDAHKDEGSLSGWGMMSVLSGCITAASAAVADAGIDCVDLVSGGVAAIVRPPRLPEGMGNGDKEAQIVQDPCPSEHQNLVAVCAVGYLQSRDEVTEVWTRGDIGGVPLGQDPLAVESLVDQAVEAAVSSRLVLEEALREILDFKSRKKTTVETPFGAKEKQSG